MAHNKSEKKKNFIIYKYPVSSKKANVIRENTLFCVYVPVIASFSNTRFSQ